MLNDTTNNQNKNKVNSLLFLTGMEKNLHRERLQYRRKKIALEKKMIAEGLSQG
jgi:hypothetical protein